MSVELNDAPKQQLAAECARQVSEREIEIAHALNDLVSGRTNIVDLNDVGILLNVCGHPVSYLIPLLLTDIIMTESNLSPAFGIDEIQDVATTILESWSDNYHVRLQVAMDAIVEYRRPAQTSDSTSSVLRAPLFNGPPVPDGYHQQLVCAAIQGLCANPAYSKSAEDIALTAVEIADDVIHLQVNGHE